MHRWLIIALVVVLAAVGIATASVLVLNGDGDGDEASEEPIRVTSSGSTSQIVVGASTGTAAPVERLPGVTVLGFGEVEVKPDVAIVRLTVGSGSPFSSDDGSVALVDERELEPVVEALVDAGAEEDEIYVDAFGDTYGPSENAAVITLMWPRPTEVRELLRLAQRAIREETDLNLQQLSVTFARDDCDGPEAKAMEAAIADARERAERLASLSDAKIGSLIAVSESDAAGYLSAFAAPRCGAGELSTQNFFPYQSGTATEDEVTVTTTLEVTFALER